MLRAGFRAVTLVVLTAACAFAQVQKIGPDLYAYISTNDASANSTFLVGDKGILYAPNDNGTQFFLYPAKDFDGVNKTKPEKLRTNNNPGDQGQKDEWVEAIKTGDPSKALSNFEYAGRLTETMLLGNIAGKR